MFPQDCTLLPLSAGALLVSRSHAVFCRIPPEDVDAVRAVVAGTAAVESLAPPQRGDLERHGFFGPPRPAKYDAPSVQLQLTNACNLACAYCCTNSGGPRAEEVTFERLRAVVRQIPATLGPQTAVALLGGEPLLVPWALDLADEIVRLGLPLTIFTNGIPLADGDMAARTARLVQAGALVRVSLGGPEPATCDAISNFLFDNPWGTVYLVYADGVAPESPLTDFAPGAPLVNCTFYAGSTISEWLVKVRESGLYFTDLSGETGQWSITR